MAQSTRDNLPDVDKKRLGTIAEDDDEVGRFTGYAEKERNESAALAQSTKPEDSKLLGGKDMKRTMTTQVKGKNDVRRPSNMDALRNQISMRF